VRDAGVDLVLEQADAAEPLAVERDPARDQRGVRRAEQLGEALRHRWADAPEQLVCGGWHATQARQRVANALGDPRFRIGQRAVEIEEDGGAAHRIPARMKLCTNWRWKSRKAISSGPDVSRVAAVMTDQSTP